MTEVKGTSKILELCILVMSSSQCNHVLSGWPIMNWTMQERQRRQWRRRRQQRRQQRQRQRDSSWLVSIWKSFLLFVCCSERVCNCLRSILRFRATRRLYFAAAAATDAQCDQMALIEFVQYLSIFKKTNSMKIFVQNRFKILPNNP